MESSRWLVRPHPRPEARWQLYCLPHAGGGVSAYSAWAGALTADVELVAVCPPGRERNLAVAPHRDMSALVAELVEVIEREARPPFAFFGHSFGAAVGFELAHRLWGRAGGPQHLFVSACRPPHLRRTGPRTHLLDDDALLAELVRYGGIPAGLVDEPAVLGLVLPAIRADLEILARYEGRPGAALPCGITALGGVSDPAVDAGDLEGWRSLTRGQFRRRLLPGGHFYLTAHRDLVLEALQRDLADVPAVLRRDQDTQEALT